MSKKIKNVIAIIVLVLLIAAAAVVLYILSGDGNTPDKQLAFSVGEEKVMMDEVNFAMLQNTIGLSITEDMLEQTDDDGNSADSIYTEKVARLIADYKVECKMAEKKGIALTDDEIEDARNDAVEYLGTVNSKLMKELGITQEVLEEICRERKLAAKLEDEETKDLEKTDLKYVTIYLLSFPKIEVDENGDYVREDDGETPVMLSDAEIEEMKDKADEAYQKLKDGEDIEKLAKEYGVESISGRESNVPESFGEVIEKSIKDLKEGEYTKVLDIESAYVIIQMVDSNNSEIADEISKKYDQDVKNEKLAELKEGWYKELGIPYELDYNEKVWSTVSFYNYVKYTK